MAYIGIRVYTKWLAWLEEFMPSWPVLSWYTQAKYVTALLILREMKVFKKHKQNIHDQS